MVQARNENLPEALYHLVRTWAVSNRTWAQRIQEGEEDAEEIYREELPAECMKSKSLSERAYRYLELPRIEREKSFQVWSRIQAKNMGVKTI